MTYYPTPDFDEWSARDPNPQWMRIVFAVLVIAAVVLAVVDWWTR